MSFDLESLSAEPLIYMLMHSAAFVAVLGFVFFVLGLLFGYATWGRYKRKTRTLQSEAAAMKTEIADLKRKVGEQSVRGGPAVAMATETIHMPRQEAPLISSEPVRPPDAAPAATAVVPPALVSGSIVSTVPAGNFIKSKVPVAVPSEASAAPQSAVSSSAPAVALPVPDAHVSPLAAIKSAPPRAKESPAGAVPPSELIPTLPELPEPEPASAELVLDPHLGPVYQSRPEPCDDLTALKGISPVLEQRLQSFGIYTWWQIAGWNDEHIREISSRLAFKDRIQRERWADQARSLLEKKA
jgi:predicted flap endonuclease-1-like 5' DNA nuclease